MTGCPDNRCDGSGFLFDEERRRAYPCSCRPPRIARRRAAAVAGRLPRLLAMLRDTYDDASEYSLTDLIDRLCAVELLHVDDVGAEQTSPWVLEQLYTIVNTRYEDGRAMVLTTNLREDELERQIGPRTVSRIYEMCGTPLPMFGEDQRKGAGIIAMPGAGPRWGRQPPEAELGLRPPDGATAPRAQRWRPQPAAGDPEPWDDAFWEHGGAAPTAERGYGRPPSRRGGGPGTP